MIIGTIMAIMYLSSGANFMLAYLDDMEDMIEAEMSDDVKRNAVLNSALDVVDKMEDVTDDYDDADKDDEKALHVLIQQYDSSVTDIQATMDITYSRRIEYQQHMLALHHELKARFNRDDWNKLFAARLPTSASRSIWATHSSRTRILVRR